MPATKELTCRVVTPTEQLLDEPITYASIPAWDGLFGVLPGHAPLVAKLGTGELKLEFPSESHGGGDRSYYVSGGFVQIANDELIILADEAIPAEQLTPTDAKAELAEAEARNVDPAAEDKAAAADELKLQRDRARAKLRIAQSRAGKGI
ncbi:MAG: ATP synthase epsilon chain [Phycisphaeraceae bacterium]|nr:MAG: ATP synthase epsilon chain [Phycisphaeraceae bacterium]